MNNELRMNIEKCLQQLPADSGGGCPLDKALIMAEYIVSENIQCSVEIGVYKGRSFFPQAFAHLKTGGKIIGVDPFSKNDARENDVSPELKRIIDDSIDSWDSILSYVYNLKKIMDWQLGNCATIIRETSEIAAKYINDEIGMLHIDGNHDTKFVSKDISLYLPKIKHGGLIIMDDTDWSSVQSCLYLLNSDCVLEKDNGTWQAWRKK